MAKLPDGFFVRDGKIVATIKRVNFLIGEYKRVGEASSLSLFGFNVYARLGASWSLFGLVFRGPQT